MRDANHLLDVDDSLEELRALADTAGLEVVGEMTQKLEQIEPATFIGKGKVEELKTWQSELGFEVALFDDELSPRHQRNLEQELGEKARVLDRTALILDIFAQHAHTREGALQVELAQYEYRLPRLTRGWTHLVRQAGGGAGRSGTAGVGLRGPGETQLEVDRRQIRARITFLKEPNWRTCGSTGSSTARSGRRAQVPVVSIVGYTNAGKSSLLNALVDAAGAKQTLPVLTEDKLFATLDPTTRRVRLPGGKPRCLPIQWVSSRNCPRGWWRPSARRSKRLKRPTCCCTWSISRIPMRGAGQGRRATLDDLEITDIPIVVALNKIDRLEAGAARGAAGRAFPAQRADLGAEADQPRAAAGAHRARTVRKPAAACRCACPIADRTWRRCFTIMAASTRSALSRTPS